MMTTAALTTTTTTTRREAPATKRDGETNGGGRQRICLFHLTSKTKPSSSSSAGGGSSTAPIIIIEDDEGKEKDKEEDKKQEGKEEEEEEEICPIMLVPIKDTTPITLSPSCYAARGSSSSNSNNKAGEKEKAEGGRGGRTKRKAVVLGSSQQGGEGSGFSSSKKKTATTGTTTTTTGKEEEAVVIPDEFNGASLSLCGHRFSALALITYLGTHDMRCPICRQGDGQSRLSIADTFGNEPWVAEVQRRASKMRKPDEDEDGNDDNDNDLVLLGGGAAAHERERILNSILDTLYERMMGTVLSATFSIFRPAARLPTSMRAGPSPSFLGQPTRVFVCTLTPNNIQISRGGEEDRRITRVRYHMSDTTLRSLNEMARLFPDHILDMEISRVADDDEEEEEGTGRRRARREEEDSSSGILAPPENYIIIPRVDASRPGSRILIASRRACLMPGLPVHGHQEAAGGGVEGRPFSDFVLLATFHDADF